MPYFVWHGVNLKGDLKKGRLFAQSVHDLDAALFKRDIALLKSSKARPALLSGAIKNADKIAFFRQLSALLSAGVLLPEALNIVTGNTAHQPFQELLYALARDVHHGSCLSKALQKTPAVFDPLMVQMAYVGQEAGTLAASLAMLSDYLQERQDFNRQLRAAALMPAVTLAFFVVIAAVIFTLVIPRFATLFANVNQALPPLTTALIAVSSFLVSYSAVYVGLLLVFAGAALAYYARLPQGRVFCDKVYLKIPYLHTLIERSNVVCFLRSVSVLLESGMPLLSAVRMSRHSVTNKVLQQHMVYLEQEIESGSSLSDAMAQHPGALFGPEVLAMVSVGQESGRLSSMLASAALEYDNQVKRSLTKITTLFQPLLMIILGLLITLLIFAVYLPIFNLAQVVR